jgi:hypothetical protein
VELTAHRDGTFALAGERQDATTLEGSL